MDHVIDVIGKSPVLHGPRDEMAYLMYLDPVDAPLIVENLEMLACSRGYSKVVAKVPAKETGRFLAAGYQLEAALPCLSHEDDAACYMAKYFCSDRKTELQPLLVREVLAAAHQQQPVGVLPAPMDARVYELPESEYGRVADFLGRFSSASPVDPAPVSAARRKGVLFFGASANDELAALACVTVDANTASTEITELLCTKEAEEYWVNHLLQQLERELLAAGTKRLFAMARAYSFGNNIVFARNGYCFAGTLTNNSCRHGRMESANAWFKHLQEDPQMAWSSVFKKEELRNRMQDSPFPPNSNASERI
ncbi:n-acetyltransferase GCN5 [Geoanaerobacter pelophilus]|uniref:N-acetyltransferase GCN5 n=1 Tax=Geoanaerobacter pelophilus TaxID=60036 RepID=A0ABQ0ME93_9BACT|nr:hypothetical protein [Geoanaerobacter pelophilus]GAW65430.1 n-acetyltransferase GCN5 [Geoanaerobacter pelophilus]